LRMAKPSLQRDKRHRMDNRAVNEEVMKSVEDIINTLNDDEREQFSELIDTCREREALLKKSETHMAQDFEKLLRLSERFHAKTQNLYSTLRKLEKSCQLLNDTTSTFMLQLISDDQFYHS